MTWDDWIANGSVNKHTTSLTEIGSLRELIKRDLRDADIDALSDDRRFATAYMAAVQISKMTLACAGYRLAKSSGVHHNSFETVKTAIPTSEIEDLCDYFDTCRRKRHKIEYDGSDIVTQTETEEIISKANEYLDAVEIWITNDHPNLRAV